MTSSLTLTYDGSPVVVRTAKIEGEIVDLISLLRQASQFHPYFMIHTTEHGGVELKLYGEYAVRKYDYVFRPAPQAPMPWWERLRRWWWT